MLNSSKFKNVLIRFVEINICNKLDITIGILLIGKRRILKNAIETNATSALSTLLSSINTKAAKEKKVTCNNVNIVIH